MPQTRSVDLFTALASATDDALQAHLDAQPPEEFALRFMQGLRRTPGAPRWMREINTRAFTSVWAMTVQRDGPMCDGEIVDGVNLWLLRGALRVNAPEVGEAVRAGLALAQMSAIDMIAIQYTVVTLADAPLKMPASVYAVALDEIGDVIGATLPQAQELGVPDVAVSSPPSGAFAVLEVHTATGCVRAASQVVDGRAVGPVWLAPTPRSNFGNEVRRVRTMHAAHGEVQ